MSAMRVDNPGAFFRLSRHFMEYLPRAPPAAISSALRAWSTSSNPSGADVDRTLQTLVATRHGRAGDYAEGLGAAAILGVKDKEIG